MVGLTKNFQKEVIMDSHYIFATNNPHKVAEIKAVLNNRIAIISLLEAGIVEDIPEPWNSFHENALEKVTVIHKLTRSNCFSEDTGLEVDILDGAPGVKSARYAGEHATAQDNIVKLLEAMQFATNRQARFKTVIALHQEGQIYYFEGICEGEILQEPIGNAGFGYDPLFSPQGANGKSFASMTMDEKNKYSHRKKAVELLVNHLMKESS